ncbi:MAG: hypothetical protein H7840_02165 [Alphaproteobacteria bacterium]
MATETGGRKGRTVAFEHKFFASFPGMYFRMSEQGDEAVLFLKMAEYEAALPIPGIRREFLIDDKSPDGQMLTLVTEALGYVKGLRIGDPLPLEVFSDGASWTPSERHKIIAYQRLTMQLVTWLSGDETIISNPDELMQVASDPNAQRKVNIAFGEAAEKLGLGRDHREEVVGYIERLADELAYVEALRDRFQGVIGMETKIQGLRRLYSERSVLEIADPVARLIERAVRDFKAIFDEMDAQTGEILAALKNIDSQIKFISRTRNGLYRRLMAWEDIITEWKPVAIRRSNIIPDLLRKTYQFLAPRFMQVKEWSLATQPEREKKKLLRAMEW